MKKLKNFLEIHKIFLQKKKFYSKINTIDETYLSNFSDEQLKDFINNIEFFFVILLMYL